MSEEAYKAEIALWQELADRELHRDTHHPNRSLEGAALIAAIRCWDDEVRMTKEKVAASAYNFIKAMLKEREKYENDPNQNS